MATQGTNRKSLDSFLERLRLRAPLASRSASALPASLGIGFGLGSTSMSILGIASSYILVFFSTELGIAAATAGLYIALTKIYDAVTDPLMGVISDRTKSRWGRRRPWLFVGAFLGGLAFVGLFIIPKGLEGPLLHAYVIAALLFSATAYTVFRVPHWAMSAEITNSPQQRTKLMSYSAVLGLIGAAGGGASIPYMLEYFKKPDNSRAAFESMSLIMGAIVFIAAMLCFILTRRAPSATPAAPSKLSVLKQFRSAFTTRPFVILIISHGVFMLGSALLNTSGIFFIDYVLKVPRSYLGNVFAIQIAATLISQPFWVRAATAFGKKNCYIFAVLMFCAGNLSWLLASGTEPFFILLIRMAVLGAGGAGIALSAMSMLPDTMEYDQLQTGVPRQGLLAGVYTTLEKFSLAAGVAMLGFLLDVMDFKESKSGIITQSPRAVLGIELSFAVLPALFALISMIILLRYRLDENTLDIARARAAASPD